MTQEKKDELTKLLNDLENRSPFPEEVNYVEGKIAVLKDILSEAVVLPKEETWYDVKQSVVLENVYPNGVIIG
jgi:hypothetical protein